MQLWHGALPACADVSTRIFDPGRRTRRTPRTRPWVERRTPRPAVLPPPRLRPGSIAGRPPSRSIAGRGPPAADPPTSRCWKRSRAPNLRWSRRRAPRTGPGRQWTSTDRPAGRRRPPPRLGQRRHEKIFLEKIFLEKIFLQCDSRLTCGSRSTEEPHCHRQSEPPGRARGTGSRSRRRSRRRN